MHKKVGNVVHKNIKNIIIIEMYNDIAIAKLVQWTDVTIPAIPVLGFRLFLQPKAF